MRRTIFFTILLIFIPTILFANEYSYNEIHTEWSKAEEAQISQISANKVYLCRLEEKVKYHLRDTFVNNLDELYAQKMTAIKVTKNHKNETVIEVSECDNLTPYRCRQKARSSIYSRTKLVVSAKNFLEIKSIENDILIYHKQKIVQTVFNTLSLDSRITGERVTVFDFAFSPKYMPWRELGVGSILSKFESKLFYCIE